MQLERVVAQPAPPGRGAPARATRREPRTPARGRRPAGAPARGRRRSRALGAARGPGATRTTADACGWRSPTGSAGPAASPQSGVTPSAGAWRPISAAIAARARSRSHCSRMSARAASIGAASTRTSSSASSPPTLITRDRRLAPSARSMRTRCTSPRNRIATLGTERPARARPRALRAVGVQVTAQPRLALQEERVDVADRAARRDRDEHAPRRVDRHAQPARPVRSAQE